MLEVVDDQQQLAVSQIAPQTVGSGPVGPVAMPQRAGDLGGDQGRVGQPLEPHQHGAVPVLGLEPARELEAQPRLSDAAGADQSHHAHVRVGQQSLQHRQLRLAPDQLWSPAPGRLDGRRLGAAAGRSPADVRGVAARRPPRRAAASRRVRASARAAGRAARRAPIRARRRTRAARGQTRRARPPGARIGTAPASAGPTGAPRTDAPTPTTRARPRAHRRRRPRGQLRRAATAPEAASPRAPGATARCFPRTRRRTAARRGCRPSASPSSSRARPGSALASSTSASNRRQSSSNSPARSEYPAASRTTRSPSRSRSLDRWTCKRRNRARRLTLPPQLVDQAIARERHPAGHQEQRQQRTLMPARQRHRVAVALQDERSQNPESTDALGHCAKRTAGSCGPLSAQRRVTTRCPRSHARACGHSSCFHGCGGS